MNDMTTKRQRINLEMIGVPLGAVLTLAENENITCVVSQQYPAQVVYEGEVTSLSVSARRACKLKFPVQGPIYWKYEGETLQERRERFEVYHSGGE